MTILVFRTNIKSKKKVKTVKPIFNKHDDILEWTIDLDDIDNVLRIEANKSLQERTIIGMVREQGFYIEALSD